MVRQLAPALNQLALVGGYAFSCLPGKAGERASVPEAESNRALRRDWGRNRLEPPAHDCCQSSIVENSGGFRVDYARCTDRSVGCDDDFDQYPYVLARLFRDRKSTSLNSSHKCA